MCVGLNQTLELSEMTRQQLEEEIMALNREKGDVQEQLSSVRPTKITTHITTTTITTHLTTTKITTHITTYTVTHSLGSLSHFSVSNSHYLFDLKKGYNIF